MNQHTKEKLTSDVLSLLNSNYTLDKGVTKFQGQSISFLISELRYKGWKGLGPMYKFEDILVDLGFKIIHKAQGYNSVERLAGYCRCVTL